MNLIDFILNLAGLLLWLAWRSQRLDPLRGATPATLAGTLRRADPLRFGRWHFVSALFLLLLIRAWFYSQVGPAVDWTPRLDLFFIVLPFRAHLFPHALLFSALSFLQMLVICYTWFLAIAILNHGRPEPDPICRLILFQLGRVARWPRGIQLLLPLLTGLILWLVFSPALASIGIITPPDHYLRVIGQGLLVGGGVYFTLKYLLPLLLLLHVIESYVFLGTSPFWDFVNATVRPLLNPLTRLPLRIGKVDLRPFTAILIILLVLQTLPDFVRSQMLKRHLPVWPD